jgi:small subunit ribosomal protein S5
MARPNDQRRDRRENQEPREFEEKVVQVSRVSKKTKGGNQFGFSVLMVVGDRQGRVGVGLGKAPDVMSAIKKGVRKAKKRMFTVPMDGSTIPFSVEVKRGAGRIMLKPAPRGTGVIAGGPIRAVVEAAGIRDISSKILGTNNKASNVYTTFAALNELRRLVDTKGIQLKSIVEEEREQKLKEQELLREAKAKAAEQQAEEKAAAKDAKAKAPAKKAAPKKADAKPVAKKTEKSEDKPAKTEEVKAEAKAEVAEETKEA